MIGEFIKATAEAILTDPSLARGYSDARLANVLEYAEQAKDDYLSRIVRTEIDARKCS